MFQMVLKNVPFIALPLNLPHLKKMDRLNTMIGGLTKVNLILHKQLSSRTKPPETIVC